MKIGYPVRDGVAPPRPVPHCFNKDVCYKNETIVVASTVLIVEDDPSAVELLRLYLRRDGHKVLVASDGLEGLRLARKAHPDLVVLDLMLPRLDGPPESEPSDG